MPGGTWRVVSADLGRDLEEDISISPASIVDFGVHDQGDPRAGKRTLIDLVTEHGGAADVTRMARRLLSREPLIPLSLADQHLAADGLEAGSEAQKAVEGSRRGAAAVEA